MNRIKLITQLLIIGFLFIIGCGNGGNGEEEAILLADENNYSFEGTLDIPIIETACAENAVDIVIDWSALTTDLQFHDMDPLTDIDNIMLVRILDLTEAEVQQLLSTDELPQSFIEGYLNVENDDESTSAMMSEMTLLGTEVDITVEYIDDERTYMLLLATGLTPGTGARMLAFLDPEDESLNTTIAIEPWPILDFSADLTSITPVDIPTDGPWVVDWSGLTKNGQDNDIVFESIDGVMLGFYAGETLESLEDDVLDLELIADELYEMELPTGGMTFDFADLDGFTDLSGDGTWMFGLTCSMCQNPAPLFLTALNPT